MVRKVDELSDRQFLYRVACASWQEPQLPCRWPACAPPAPVRERVRNRLRRYLWDLSGHGYARAVSRDLDPE